MGRSYNGYSKKIEQHRAAEERLQWEGTFAEYLELVKERPWVAQTAHSHLQYDKRCWN